MTEEFLPKPQTDLPLPEKQIPAHLTSQDLQPKGHALQNKTKWLILSLILVTITLVGIAGGKYYLDQQKLKAINDFTSCAAAGNPIAESYPASCRTSDGRSFTQVLSEEEQKNLLPDDPAANWEITKSTTNAGWKVYKNKALGYSLEIPIDWKHKFDTDNNATIFQSPDIKINENLGRATEGSEITLRSGVVEETSIEKLFNDYWNQPHGGGSPENKTIEYIDTNIKALRYEFHYESSQVETEFIKDGYRYSIGINFPWVEEANTWSKRDLPVYDQILSTFRFTDPSLSCTPRPSCLDTEPRCMIAETEDMCPPNPTPSI